MSVGLFLFLFLGCVFLKLLFLLSMYTYTRTHARACARECVCAYLNDNVFYISEFKGFVESHYTRVNCLN